jgi:D-glycero-D-manno-heptose 1,7-bisphosphate phosphatase
MLVILDRDGVINEDLPTGVTRWEDFRFIPHSCDAIAKLCAAKHTVVIATNQSNVGRGLMMPETLAEIHYKMCEAITAAGGHISQIYVAPDAPDSNTQRRKPAPGMLLEAMRDYQSSPEQTVMIGDALRDIEAAAHAGIASILVATGKGHTTRGLLPQSLAHTPYAFNLAEAVKLVLASADKDD